MRPLGRLVGVAALLLAPVLGSALVSRPAAAAPEATTAASAASTYQSSQTFLFSSTNHTPTFTVPPGVTRIFIDATGGGGGRGGSSGIISGGSGGVGGEVTGEAGVQPGDQIPMTLGGVGSNGWSGNYAGGHPNGGGSGGQLSGGAGGLPSDTVSGAGAGGGEATTVSIGSSWAIVAGGGGGGGGGGGIAGYDGGAGGTGGAAGRQGARGTGVGAGAGGGVLACPIGAGGQGGDASNLAGGGGGGGGGYAAVFCAGAGGSGGGLGEGAGGGGGAGGSFVGSMLSSPTINPSPLGGAGRVTIAWAQPQSTLALSASTWGTTARLTATASPASGLTDPAPSGTVAFTDAYSGLFLGNATLSGGAATLTVLLGSGTRSISAHYEGDAVYGSSDTFTTITLAKAKPTVSGLISANPVPWNGSGSITAQVVPPGTPPVWAPMPTGLLSLTDTYGSTSVTTTQLQLSGAAGEVVTIPVEWSANTASHTYTLDYAGDANYSAASTSVSVPVSPATGSRTSLMSSRNPAVVGQSVTFTATVARTSGTALPTGSVTFQSFVPGFPFARTLGTSAVGSDGKASVTVAAQDLAGSQDVWATYGGDSASQGSTSNTITQLVNAASPPVARAGADQTATFQAQPTLDGSLSSDPQGEPLTYRWSQVDGPVVTLADRTEAKTKVTVPSTAGVAHLRLTVTNAAGLSSSDDMAITVKAPK